jgi:signal transduction histidine kinase
MLAVNRSLGFDSSVAIKPPLFIVVTYFIFKFLLHIWPERYRLLPRSIMLMTVLMIFLVMTLLQSSVWLLATDLVLPPAAFLSGISLRVGVFMAVSLMTFGTANRRHAAEELEAPNDKLALLISTLKRELWTVQRNIALSLHGSVQSALVSSQILLSRPNVSDEDLAEARHRIEEALVRVGVDHARTPEIDLAVAAICGLWQDTSEINVNIPEDCKQRMAGDIGLTSAAAEIVRECVSNAVRRGAARRLKSPSTLQSMTSLFLNFISPTTASHCRLIRSRVWALECSKTSRTRGRESIAMAASNSRPSSRSS